MASIYKRTKDRADRKSVWYFAYIDEHGRQRCRKGFTDKSATEKLAHKMEDDARLIRAGVKVAAPSEKERTIAYQLAAYAKHLLQRDITEFQVNGVKTRIEKIAAACSITEIQEITTEKVEDYLAARRKEGISKQTSNHYRQAMNQFCKWLLRHSRIRSNPISEIPKLNIQTDRRHDRRALSMDEFQRLIQAAESGPPVETIDGIDRAMMYVLSAWTGYRRGEIASLTLDSFDLSSDPPIVTVDAKISKRRKQDTQVIHPEVVDRFQYWLSVRTPKHDRFLFPISKEACGFERKTAKMMRRDLEAARKTWINEADSDAEREVREKSNYLKYESDNGLFADFHANRHMFITNLARAGVLPKVAQTLARHSDIRLTMNVYSHIDRTDEMAAVSKLPSLLGPPINLASKPAVKNGEQCEPVQSRQYIGSTLKAEDATLGHNLATGGNLPKKPRPKERRRKSLLEKGLAAEDNTSQSVSEISSAGVEPTTFGFGGRRSIQLSYEDKIHFASDSLRTICVDGLTSIDVD